MAFMDESLPLLSDTMVPAVVRGTADLTTFAYQGNGYEALLDRIYAIMTGRDRDRPRS